jgi:abequosyltransferase
MTIPRISICIPTYNRSQFLVELLDSIYESINYAGVSAGQLQICISDNASTDDTAEIVHYWNADHPTIPLRLEVQATNGGPDRNYLAAASLATGDYVWFMGSDDTLPLDAVKVLLTEVQNGNELILGSRTNCNSVMQPLYHCRWFGNIDRRTFDTRKSSELREYLTQATSLGAQFSYLSSVIVRRDAWERVSTDLSYIGSAYVHVQKCVDILRQGATLLYLTTSIVNNRGDNDYFASSGAVNRAMIDIRGYVRLSGRFDDPSHKLLFLTALRRERPPIHTAFFLRKNATEEQWREAAPLLRSYGTSAILVRILTIAPSLVRILDRPFVQRFARRVLGRRLPTGT